MKKRILLAVMLFSFLNIIAQNPYDVKATNLSETKTVVKSKDEKFIEENFPFIQMSNWTGGMKFMIFPDEDNSPNNYLFDIHEYKSVYKVRASEYYNKIFTVENIEERIVDCPRGNCTRTYVIFNCDSKKFEYEYIGDRKEMSNSDVFTNIHDLVYLDEIDNARKLLIGKTFYVISRLNTGFQHNNYIPIIIKNVGIGTINDHVKIIYETTDKKQFEVNTTLSGTNTSPIFDRFQNIFSLENPKNKYPKINAEIWSIIQKGKVRSGMTKQECRLSWGEPESINKTSGKWGVHEQWVYSTSSYLYFENGKLTSIQN